MASTFSWLVKSALTRSRKKSAGFVFGGIPCPMEANLRGRGRSMGKKSSQLPRAHPGSRAADLDRSISTAGTWRVFASDSPLDGSLSVAHVWHGVAFQGYQIGARSFQALPCGAIGVAED
eukprot:10176124-Prorocentrum_lima.AAC.1